MQPAEPAAAQPVHEPQMSIARPGRHRAAAREANNAGGEDDDDDDAPLVSVRASGRRSAGLPLAVAGRHIPEHWRRPSIAAQHVPPADAAADVALERRRRTVTATAAHPAMSPALGAPQEIRGRANAGPSVAADSDDAALCVKGVEGSTARARNSAEFMSADESTHGSPGHAAAASQAPEDDSPFDSQPADLSAAPFGQGCQLVAASAPAGTAGRDSAARGADSPLTRSPEAPRACDQCALEGADVADDPEQPAADTCAAREDVQPGSGGVPVSAAPRAPSSTNSQRGSPRASVIPETFFEPSAPEVGDESGWLAPSAAPAAPSRPPARGMAALASAERLEGPAETCIPETLFPSTEPLDYDASAPVFQSSPPRALQSIADPDSRVPETPDESQDPEAALPAAIAPDLSPQCATARPAARLMSSVTARTPAHAATGARCAHAADVAGDARMQAPSPLNADEVSPNGAAGTLAPPSAGSRRRLGAFLQRPTSAGTATAPSSEPAAASPSFQPQRRSDSALQGACAANSGGEACRRSPPETAPQPPRSALAALSRAAERSTPPPAGNVAAAKTAKMGSTAGRQPRHSSAARTPTLPPPRPSPQQRTLAGAPAGAAAAPSPGAWQKVSRSALHTAAEATRPHPSRALAQARLQVRPQHASAAGVATLALPQPSASNARPSAPTAGIAAGMAQPAACPNAAACAEQSVVPCARDGARFLESEDDDAFADFDSQEAIRNAGLATVGRTSGGTPSRSPADPASGSVRNAPHADELFPVTAAPAATRPQPVVARLSAPVDLTDLASPPVPTNGTLATAAVPPATQRPRSTPAPRRPSPPAATIGSDDAACRRCGSRGDEDRMLLCDRCDAAYHTFCLRPKLDSVPVDDWFCPVCVREEAARGSGGKRKRSEAKRPAKPRPSSAAGVAARAQLQLGQRCAVVAISGSAAAPGRLGGGGGAAAQSPAIATAQRQPRVLTDCDGVGRAAETTGTRAVTPLRAGGLRGGAAKPAAMILDDSSDDSPPRHAPEAVRVRQAAHWQRSGGPEASQGLHLAQRMPKARRNNARVLDSDDDVEGGADGAEGVGARFR